MSTFNTFPLGELVTLRAGVGFPVDMQGRTAGDFPLAKVGDISRVGRSGKAVIAFADHYIDESDLVRLRTKPVPEGSILFAKIGEAMSHNHRVIAGCDMLIDNNAMAAIPGDRLISRYLYHFLRTVDFYRLASSTTVPALRKSELEKVKVPLPTLAEQRRISEVLDRAEALRAKRRAALTLLDSLTQSLFLDLFGDTRKERTRWPTVRLDAIVRETKLGLVRGSQEFGPDFPIPYVRMNAITRKGELELTEVQRTNATPAEIEAYRLEPGDFLFNTRNSEELVGKTALYRGGGLHLFNNNVMRIRFTAKADPVFVAAAFKTAFVQHELNLRKSGTTNVFAIYYKDLRSLPLPLPPIKLQVEFARRVTAVEKVKTAQRVSLAELDALFASLQHKAFRGEL